MSPPWQQARQGCRPRRSRPPVGEPDPPPAPAVDRIVPLPSDIRLQRSGPRHSPRLFRPRRNAAQELRVVAGRPGLRTQSPASPPAALAPQAATPPRAPTSVMNSRRSICIALHPSHRSCPRVGGTIARFSSMDRVESAYPPRAAATRTCRHPQLVPQAAVSKCSNTLRVTQSPRRRARARLPVLQGRAPSPS